jgi:hypothetical protein
MTTHASGTFKVTSWDEKTYDDMADGAGLARVSARQTFVGDIQGEGTVEYLMAYTDDKSASYVGMVRVVGLLGGRSGSFVLQLNGRYADGKAEASWFVVPGSGSDELQGLSGEGGFPPHGEGDLPYTLDYDFA